MKKYKKIDFNMVKNAAVDVGADIIGGFMYSLGVYTFAAASNFTSGGVSGIAIIFNYLFNLPIGVVTLLLNVPLALLAFFKLGKKMVMKTVKTVIIVSLITDLVMPHIPLYTGDPILAAMACGITMGFGIALIFLRGSSTGGSDFLALVLKKRFPHMNVGFIIMMQDVAVILVSILAFKNIDAALYGAISIFINGKIIDTVLYGFESGTVMFIVTDSPKEISAAIADSIDRGSTLIPARGGYTGNEKTVLMVVLRKNQIASVKRIVREFDDTAFVTALEATEILGEGFKPHGN